MCIKVPVWRLVVESFLSGGSPGQELRVEEVVHALGSACGCGGPYFLLGQAARTVPGHRPLLEQPIPPVSLRPGAAGRYSAATPHQEHHPMVVGQVAIHLFVPTASLPIIASSHADT
jgi:hypothetical protein